MQKTLPSGFQIVSSPGYQVVILSEVSKSELRAMCLRLDHFIKSMDYQVEDWSANPIFIMNPGSWVPPCDQRKIEDWVLQQAACKYLRTQRDKNQRHEAMRLEFWNEFRAHIDMRELEIP